MESGDDEQPRHQFVNVMIYSPSVQTTEENMEPATNESDRTDNSTSVIPEESDNMEQDEQSLFLAEQRKISWLMFGEDQTYEEIKEDRQDLLPLKSQVPPPLPPRPKNLVLRPLPPKPTTKMSPRRRWCSRRSVIVLAVTGGVILLVLVAVILAIKFTGAVNI